MRGMSSAESAAVGRCADAPMLAQIQLWAAINSGSRNLPGLGAMADILAGVFADLLRLATFLGAPL